MSAAREAGLDVDRLFKLPMVSCDMKKDESAQVNLPCPECVSLEKIFGRGYGRRLQLLC